MGHSCTETKTKHGKAFAVEGKRGLLRGAHMADMKPDIQVTIGSKREAIDVIYHCQSGRAAEEHVKILVPIPALEISMIPYDSYCGSQKDKEITGEQHTDIEHDFVKSGPPPCFETITINDRKGRVRAGVNHFCSVRTSERIGLEVKKDRGQQWGRWPPFKF